MDVKSTSIRHSFSFLDFSDDILQDILEATYHKGPSPGTDRCNNRVLRRALRLSHVCFRLRNLAINMPVLWSTIWYGMHDGARQTCLQRSKNVGLHISIVDERVIRSDEDESKSRSISAFLDIIATHILRWRVLFITLSDPKLAQQFLGLAQGRTLPMLEAVTVDLHEPYYFALDDPDKWGRPVFDWSTPNLAFLDCTEVWPAPAAFAPNMQRCSVYTRLQRDPPFCFSSRDIRRLLVPLTSITQSALIKISPDHPQGTSDDWYEHDKPIVLPNLREFEGWMEAHDELQLTYWKTFLQIGFPSLVSVHLSFLDFPEMDHEIIAALIQMLSGSPLIERFVLDWGPAIKLESLLNSTVFPSLKRIKLGYGRIDTLFPAYEFPTLEDAFSANMSWVLPPQINFITFHNCNIEGIKEELDARESAHLTRLYRNLQQCEAWEDLRGFEVIHCQIHNFAWGPVPPYDDNADNKNIVRLVGGEEKPEKAVVREMTEQEWQANYKSEVDPDESEMRERYIYDFDDNDTWEVEQEGVNGHVRE